MSCRPCQDAQNGLTETSSYYFRWRDATIELRGCQRHIEEVMDWLRKSFDEKSQQQESPREESA